MRETVRLRDGSLILAKKRTYREYPMEWIIAHMEQAGFTVLEAVRKPLYYGKTWVDSQLDVAVRHLYVHLLVLLFYDVGGAC